MEDRRGILLYVAWIMRIIAVVLLAALLIFFVIRVVRNRQASNTAEQAVKTATNAPDSNKQTGAHDSTNKDSNSSDKSQSDQDSSSTLEIPGGVADSEITSKDGSSLPDAGMNPQTVLLATVILCSLTYGAVWVMQSRARRISTVVYDR